LCVHRPLLFLRLGHDRRLFSLLVRLHCWVGLGRVWIQDSDVHIITCEAPRQGNNKAWMKKSPCTARVVSDPYVYQPINTSRDVS
jgi:hypothetical protein